MSTTDIKNTMQWWILQYEEADIERRRLREIIKDLERSLDQLRTEIAGLQHINAATMSSVRNLSKLNNELTLRIQSGYLND